ncbi:Cd(II)/Pb(II)-responsive transcriptional regulator [Neisseria sp. Ec49-e6-T10]|uniref:Cd(II)/Pb(II)-responsive transcriptional regulator n=1 Tax=Neisseria sp. Ec49-e6-T10 TaxID=3140744 RepID=UPI003EB84A86
MKIGELAKIAHCTVETIRFYEKEGLMPEPIRTANNYRHYTQIHVERLRFIRNCRALDLNHEEIRALLHLSQNQADNCQAALSLLDEHLCHVKDRIQELQQLEKRLEELYQKCQLEHHNAQCGILQTLSEQEVDSQTNAPPNTHIKHDFSHH